MILVSACLIGINCRYDGKSSLNEELQKLVKEGKAIAVCPEVLGGLSIPRTPCEIRFIKDEMKIMTEEDKDFTNEFMKGAKKALEIAKSNNVKIAIMKSKSPSCGCGKIYDGSFSRRLINGDGVTVSLFKENGIQVLNELNYSDYINLNIKY